MHQSGSPYGIHRVIEPRGVLPQPAWKIDNSMEIFDNEILIDVAALNIDSASFTQIKKEAAGDLARALRRSPHLLVPHRDRGPHGPGRPDARTHR